jgi:hypothetical protein
MTGGGPGCSRVSLWQGRRLLVAGRAEVVAIVAHGNRGRHPARTIDVATRYQVRTERAENPHMCQAVMRRVHVSTNWV